MDKLTGVDVSSEALRLAREREPDAELVKLDVTQEPLVGQWDLVFSSLLLEHVIDDGAVLAAMRDATNRHLVITTIAGDFERYRPWEERVGHVRNYRPGELESKLGAAEFSVEKAIYWGRPFFSPLARRLQNRMSPEASYDRRTRLVAAVLHKVYYFNSSRRGDLLVILARPV